MSDHAVQSNNIARERNLSWALDASKEREQPSKKRRKPKKQPPLNSVCPMCEASIKTISYKDVYQLKRFISLRGKIIGKSKSGVCSKHQRQLAKAIKRSRQLGLLPFVNFD